MGDEVERVDLGPLDPTADRQRFEEKVAAIMAAAGEELTARRYRHNALGQVAVWRRPLLAAAAVVGIVSAAALATIDTPSSATEADTGLAEAIGVPAQVAEWLSSDELPGLAELLMLEGER
jgi:hypothetical protein